MSEQEQPERIRDYVFSDIYIDQGGNGIPAIRGLARKDGKNTKPGHAVTKIPKSLYRDVGMLAHKVFTHNKDTRAREFLIEHDNVRYRCAMISAPSGISSTKVEKISWCLRRVAEDVPKLTDFGLPGWLTARLHGAWADRGLTLISGPFGSGKTTLASSTFISWVKYSGEVGVSLEDPPEVDFERQELDGGMIFQIDLVDRSMSEAIRYARRWAPRYVLVGEIRSPEAAVEMLAMAKSGPAVITTIHASETVSAITQLIQFASGRMSENDARQTVSAALSGVMHMDSRSAASAAQYLSVGDHSDHLVRGAINDGKYTSLNEELSRQMILRKKM